jgi:methyl-accepting chemotaxis protein
MSQNNWSVAKLGASSAEIGTVVCAITQHAEQANLLVLKATI